MAISLDWEESLFVGMRALWRRFRPEQSPWDPDKTAFLKDLNGRLIALAAIIGRRPLLVREAEAAGGVRGGVVLLPHGMDLADSQEDNIRLLCLRTVISAALSTRPALVAADELSNRLNTLFALRDTVDELGREFPKFKQIHQHAARVQLAARPEPDSLPPLDAALERLRQDLLMGRTTAPREVILADFKKRKGVPKTPGLLLWGETLSSAEAALADQAAVDEQVKARPADGDEVAAPPRDQVQRIAMPPQDEVKPVPFHTFEKVETLDAYKGGSRQIDGADELEEHEEALSEVDLRQVVRGGEDVRGIYRAELDLDGGIPDVTRTEPDGQGISYPEWCATSKAYKTNWTTVYPATISKREDQWGLNAAHKHRRMIESLYRRLLPQRSRNQWQKRLTMGSEIDMDALTDAHGLRRAGQDAGNRFYQERRPLQRETATAVLLDISLSSGSWIEDRKVLDVTREAVVVLGEVAERLHDQFGVWCFASHTRNHCRVWQIKGWRESWREGRGRLGPLRPMGYTRIGPALRHVTASLDRMDAKHKLLLLLTDGKPTDYDRYEGRHGVEDVKMAVREAHQMGIHLHALAIDPSARAGLPVMFGPAGWHLIRHLGQMPEAMTRAYARLTT